MKKLAYLTLICFAAFSYAQEPITSIPFELFGDHIIIKVSLDDSEPLDFVFDTGSGLTVVDNDIADKLKLTKKPVDIGNVSKEIYLTQHNKIEINDFLMEKNIKVYATSLNHFEISLGRDIDGILGYDLLVHHSVIINYDNLMLHIYDHGNVPKEGDKIPFSLEWAIPTIEGKVVLNNNEPHDGTFFIMTGAGTTLDFNSPYAKKFDVINKTGKHFSYYVKGISNEETIHYEGHILSLAFGNQKVEDLPVGISDAKSGIQADPKVAGIIGSQILRMYNITIDVPDKVMYLTKNKSWGKKFMINSSGVDVQLSENKDKVLIHQVFENSPASEAGIKLNDELLKINGKSTAEVNLAEIKDMLKQEGETVDLVVNQKGQEKAFSLKLRSLID
ncbi:MAG: aspartyl protease family protein [Bacteroidota bacterium]